MRGLKLALRVVDAHAEGPDVIGPGELGLDAQALGGLALQVVVDAPLQRDAGAHLACFHDSRGGRGKPDDPGQRDRAPHQAGTVP